MAPGGLFTTYSSKGSLQRILKGLNFEVEKLEGPKGKREMINAWKNRKIQRTCLCFMHRRSENLNSFQKVMQVRNW